MNETYLNQLDSTQTESKQQKWRNFEKEKQGMWINVNLPVTMINRAH